MLEQNKALVRRYYQEAVSGLAGMDAILAADFVDHHFPPGLPPGPAGVRQFFGQILAGIFSDMRIEINLLLAEGDRVDCHFVVFARHTGDYAGIPGKGHAICCPAISTFRIANGKLAEAWEIYDSGDLLRQMRGE
jgi:predicted SnoaL-like aldol condensation-catalyzing enzyme